MEQDPELAGSLPPYDNAFAITNGLANATVEEQKAFWDWAPEDDYMAYVQTNVLISVVTNAEGEASIYAIDPGTNTLYETFYVGGELFVGAVSSNDAAYAAMENGNFMTMVTNATVIHSAVYDWYGFDPTTAKPSYWWPESIAEYAESNSNYTVGANSVPFTRRLKYITQTMYLPLVGAEDDYFLTTSWTEDPSTWWTDTNGNDMPDGWELYVKYSAFSDPDKTDDDYKEDFIDSTDPNSEDTDGDGIPDDVEQYFKVTDPLVKDGDFAADGDVMAFATVNATVVTVQNSAEGSLPVRYLLAEEMAGNTVTAPKVGDYAGSLALRATYDYLVPSGANDGSVTNRCGVGTNVTLTAAAGTVNRVVAVSVEPVVLVHAQVYDYFGFDKETANATAVKSDGVNKTYGPNTKPFTALDKYLVVRYFEAYGLADAKADWKNLALAPASPDNDLDGVPDGWELYVMFGTEGVTETLEAAKISPYNYDDARELAPAGDMTVLEKWNGGAPAYNPWATDTNGNGISDVDEINYHLDEPYGDTDNDQLSDLMEYLIGNVFTNFPGVSGISATNGYSLVDGIPDYFRRVENLYLGEMFADHDFMEDVWEDQFKVATVTRGLYDPWNDPDDDGWSNYAECRAGTNPEIPANTYGIQDISIHNYPIPTIHATVMMGPGEGMLNGNVVVQSYSDTSKMTGLPDAIWTVTAGSASTGSSSSGSSTGSTGSNAKTSYLGINPAREVTLTLAPGFIRPGSISVDFLDPAYIVVEEGEPTYGNLNNAIWNEKLVEDRPNPDDATKGTLVTRAFNKENVAVGTIDYTTGLATIDFSTLTNTWYLVDDPSIDVDATNASYTVVHLNSSHVRASWDANIAGGNSWATLHLTESDDASSERTTLGHVREGKNTFVVFLDNDGSGTWNPGEPYGVAKGVDVGWSDAEFKVELTSTTPIMSRFDIASAIGGGAGSSFDTANAATDRGVVNTKLGYWENTAMAHPEACTNMPGNATSLTRVRVVRNWIDGNATRIAGNPSTSYMAVVLDRDFDLSVHPTLTEADLLADGKFDLDWGAISSVAANGMRFESATYRIVVGGDAVGNDDVGELESTVVYKNNLPVQFTNRFEPGTRQTPTVPNPEFAEIVYSSRPTFSWSHTNSINKAYPAFQLRIYADSAKQEIVYDSGVQRAPARDQNGMYEWTAPVYSGMVTDRGKVFTTTNNYYWAVSMLDAKFTGFNPNERVTPFRLSASGNFADGKEHGSILVRVKYFGALVRAPLSAVPTTMKNLVRVQAFTSPDFSGLPVAETYVTNVTNIASDRMIETNAVIRGVAPGTYYVRAYIDTDSNGVKSDWESWGYNCYVADNSVREVWAPRPIVLEANLNPPPVATVFMEDADTDNDGFPDAWEMNENGNLVAQAPVTGNTFFATVNPSLSSFLNTSLANTPIIKMSSKVSQMVALMAPAGSSSAPVETTAVQISKFSLEGGLELEVVNTTSGGDSSSIITFSKEATVNLSLMCATTPDFSDAVEVPVKKFTIRSNDTTVEAVTAEELAEARAKAPEARFFKAIIKQ